MRLSHYRIVGYSLRLVIRPRLAQPWLRHTTEFGRLDKDCLSYQIEECGKGSNKRVCQIRVIQGNRGRIIIGMGFRKPFA